MQFTSLFFFIVHDTGQQLMIDRTNFLTDGFLQIVQRTWFVSVVARKSFTHRRIVLQLGTAPWRPMLKCHRKSLWVTETDSPLLTNASYTNTRCSAGEVSIATEVANPEEKNADHLHTPSLQPEPTNWVLPIQKMSGSRGPSFITLTVVTLLPFKWTLWITLHVAFSLCAFPSLTHKYARFKWQG
jgi:hypothetical protein